MASKLTLLLTSSSLLALFAGTAAADPMADMTDKTAAAIDEVTVNGARPADKSSAGTKSDVPLVDTPQSISVIDREDLDQRGVESLNEALRYSSGISPETRGGTATRYDQLNIRGFEAPQYLDGMRLLGGAYYAIPQIDVSRLERIDVVRGPASVLYGQSSPGGILAMTSKLPTATSFGDLSMTGGTFGTAQGTFDVGGAADTDQKVLFRLNGMAERSDGQVSHTENMRYAINPALTLRPDEKTSWTLLYSWQQDPKAASYGSAPPQGSALSNPNGKIPVDFYDGETSFEKFDRSQNAVTSLFERKLDDTWTVRQNARYLRTESTYRSVYGTALEADLIHLDRAAGATDEGADAYTLDNQLAGHLTSGAVAHDVLMGVDYQHLRQSLMGGFSSDGVPALDIYAPTYGAAIPMPAYTLNQRIRQEQTGLYAQDQISLGGFHLVLSGRHDWYHSDQAAPDGSDASKMSQAHDTGRAGLLYRFENGVAPYVSYATSFEPQQAYDRQGRVLDPTTGKQTEIGIKYQPPLWDALMTVAVYDLDKTNVATRDPDDPSGLSSIAAGEVKSQGVEWETRARPLAGLDVLAAYSYIDNKVTKDNSGLAGTHPYGVPQQTASLWAHYAISTGTADGLGLGGGVRYLGRSFNGLDTITVPDATLVDLSFDYDLSKVRPNLKGVSLSVAINNLLDERYVTSCYYSSWCWFGAQRTALATVHYRW